MNQLLRRSALAALILAAAVSCGCSDMPGAPPVAQATLDAVKDIEVERLVVEDDGIGHETVAFGDAISEDGKTVIVDFWATWCGPCLMLAPELEKIASENSNVTVVKVDVDKQPELAQAFDVGAIPDMRVFKGGQMVNSLVGFQPADSILDQIQ